MPPAQPLAGEKSLGVWVGAGGGLRPGEPVCQGVPSPLSNPSQTSRGGGGGGSGRCPRPAPRPARAPPTPVPLLLPEDGSGLHISELRRGEGGERKKESKRRERGGALEQTAEPC